VKLVKDGLKVMTLAIGDGANDVSMIQVGRLYFARGKVSYTRDDRLLISVSVSLARKVFRQSMRPTTQSARRVVIRLRVVLCRIADSFA
jgi:magnesium-transporting ATPase (P-type)